MVMPFGKHAGVPVTQVPVTYLAWVLNTVALEKYPGLKRAIEARLAVSRQDPPTQSPAWVKQRVDRCYREMALLYHPDRRGGNCEAMIAINTAFDRLRGSLELE
jgi:hypothetical protein